MTEESYYRDITIKGVAADLGSESIYATLGENGGSDTISDTQIMVAKHKGYRIMFELLGEVLVLNDSTALFYRPGSIIPMDSFLPAYLPKFFRAGVCRFPNPAELNNYYASKTL